MGCSLLDCAQCCTVFSTSGFFFLIIIASLFQTQPLYIKGVEDSGKAASACYSGAIIYLVILAVSVVYWTLDIFRRKAAAALSSRGSSATLSPARKSDSSKKYGALRAENDTL